MSVNNISSINSYLTNLVQQQGNTTGKADQTNNLANYFQGISNGATPSQATSTTSATGATEQHHKHGHHGHHKSAGGDTAQISPEALAAFNSMQQGKTTTGTTDNTKSNQ